MAAGTKTWLAALIEFVVVVAAGVAVAAVVFVSFSEAAGHFASVFGVQSRSATPRSEKQASLGCLTGFSLLPDLSTFRRKKLFST